MGDEFCVEGTVVVLVGTVDVVTVSVVVIVSVGTVDASVGSVAVLNSGVVASVDTRLKDV